jgi:chromosome segregation ATPase
MSVKTKAKKLFGRTEEIMQELVELKSSLEEKMEDLDPESSSYEKLEEALAQIEDSISYCESLGETLEEMCQ